VFHLVKYGSYLTANSLKFCHPSNASLQALWPLFSAAGCERVMSLGGEQGVNKAGPYQL